MAERLEHRSIREWREEVFFMSQEEFAEKLDVNVSTLSLWETGKRKPRPKKHRLVAEALGLSPQQIEFDAPTKKALPSAA